MPLTPRLDLSALVTCHTLYVRFTRLQSAVFLLNSRMGRFAAPPGIAPEDPFSRSYGVMLPSSLTRFLSRALVFLHHPTCVGFGTACASVLARLFLEAWTHGLGRTRPPSARPFPAVRGIAIGPLHCPSPNARMDPVRKCGNVGPLSIGYAFRPGLRCRLTPGGRTCPGKPWDSGGVDFHHTFRYSCPHNRWCEVHGRSRAPLRPVAPRSPTTRPDGRIREFGSTLDSRSFSARSLSSSQLLRTV